MQKMSCEQIYNIWKSEPNLIRIVDLRDKKSYDHRHIPGAILANQQSLPQVIWENRNRLLVIFGGSDYLEPLPSLMNGSEFVIMDKHLEWFDKKLPSAGIFRTNDNREEKSDSAVTLEMLLDASTGKKAWMLIDPLAKEVSCVNSHEGVESRWQELKLDHYQLLFVLRTHEGAQASDFRLARESHARICVPKNHATHEIDIPLEQGQEIEFGDRIIRIEGTKNSQGQEILEFDFCGKHRVGGMEESA